ncbi:hypothetical protein ZWY2020_010657 [Hordeum vulgare]|nr:hypothetical protein ZWY2020_010657 [Hordeum vulgare]
MPLKKLPKSSTGFFGVQAKSFDNFRVELSDIGLRFWLDTWSTADKAAPAYDVVVRRDKRPKTDLNFPKIETRADAKFLMPEGIQAEDITSKMMKKRLAIIVSPGDTDEVAMARFPQEHPEYVQAEHEYF